MPREMRVATGVRARRIEVTWTERVAGSARPSFLLVRRRAGSPEAATDGWLLLDLDDLFQLPAAPDTPWGRVERLECVATNPGAEGELLQAALELYFPTATAPNPARVRVSVYDAVTGTLRRTVMDGISRVTTLPGPATPPFTEVRAWEVFATPGGGAEVSRGTVTFFEYTPDPVTPPPGPSRFRWAPAGGPALAVDYHAGQLRVTRGDPTGRAFEMVTDGAAAPAGRLTIENQTNPDAGVVDWRFVMDDGDLEPGVVYYYRVFGAGGAVAGEPARGSALATGVYGAHDLMYRLLPPVHQVADLDPTVSNGGRQLYRFLASFGLAVDHLRGQVDGLADRHAVTTARASFLPHLARTIGWVPDLTATENTQRQDIAFAPEIFGAVGTLRSAPALVNRVTKWPCQVKEYVNNVFLSNAPESVPIWEIWQITRSATTWSTPTALSLTTSMDGGATTLAVGATVWVIWHSDRSGRRELWFQRLGTDPGPRRVMEGAGDDAAGLSFVDEAPAAVIDGPDVRLFWTSTRAGSADVWTRLMSPAPGLAERLTDHPKADRHPAAVQDGTDLWLFWDSERRGPRDLWYRRRSGAVWGLPARVSKDNPLHDALPDQFPASLIAPAGDLWLFWCRDMGDRREIWHQVVSGGVFGPQRSLSTDLATGGRDEAPCPVLWDGRVLLLFHSNRGGPWQVWARAHDGTDWLPNVERLSAEPTADKEPAACVDSAGRLNVFWTSQRRTPWYRSRTLDLNDPHMLAEMGTFNDHGHYTYDCGTEPGDWYARDTVGLHLTPDIVDADRITAAVERATAFLEPFRPAPVRYVWPLESGTVHETLADDSLVTEEWVDVVS